jgi:hypothetical protein
MNLTQETKKHYLMENIMRKPNKNSDWNEEEKRNAVGFFALLFKVDRRINPHLYQQKSRENNLHSSDKNMDIMGT